MSQYPVSTAKGIRDGVNYLLSGPAGLGQFFQGFSTYQTGYLTGNFRVPFTSTNPVALYVAPITLGTSSNPDPYTWIFNFATAQSQPPFSLGNGVRIAGVADSNYDGHYSKTGVANCTTTQLVLKYGYTVPLEPNSSGGTATYYITESASTPSPADIAWNSTDCNARIITTSATDRVFVSAQLNSIISYTCTTDSVLEYSVAVNRYVGELNQDPTNPDYLFFYDFTTGYKKYSYNLTAGSGTLPNIETIYTTVVDNPTPNYYWYILEVAFYVPSGDLQVTQCEFAQRSLSSQVVKQ